MASEIEDAGSALKSLTVSQWDDIKKMYEYLSEDELNLLRDMSTTRTFNESIFEGHAEPLNSKKLLEFFHGRCASQATSFFMVLSVHVKPKLPRKSLSVFGEITSAPDETENASAPVRTNFIYNRGLEDVQNFNSNGGYLTLNGPTESCTREDACSLFQSRKLSIRLYDQHGQHLYPLVVDDDDPIILDYSPDDFEHVKVKVIQNTEISLTLRYVSIPMAVFGTLEIRIFNRHLLREDPNLSGFEDVHGKVVATYGRTLGNYKSQEIVLFDKNPNLSQYERINLGMGDNLLSSSRCWVVAPTLSLLHLRIDLFNSEKEPILTQDVDLETDGTYRSHKRLLSGKYYISVSASFPSPVSLPSAEDRFGFYDFARSLGQLQPPPQPPPVSAIEVFSVLVCYDCTPLRFHGRLRFTSDWTSDFEGTAIDIFKREKEKPLTLLGGGHTITVLNGSRFLTEFDTLTLICDLDGTARGSSIKGYEYLDVKRYCGRLLCSIFRGDNGFAALHYAVFSSAVQANLKVYVHRRETLRGNVSGSICARYECFRYSSQYEKNCYRIVLFEGSKEDSGWPTNRVVPLPLSRTSFVVPSYSHAMLDLDLMIGTQKVTAEIKVGYGTSYGARMVRKCREGDCMVKLELLLSPVK